MAVTYFVVGFLILLAGVIGMILVEEDVSPVGTLETVRYVSLWTAGSWLAAIFWPLLLVSVVPALVGYGIWVGFKVLKHRELDY